MPRGTPFLHRQKSGHLSRHYIFIASCTMHFSWSICFCFQFYFVLFAAINGWITSCSFWRRWTPLSIAKNTLVFTLLVERVFSFSATAFSFHFSPWFLFRSYYIFASRCILTSGPCWFLSKELFKKGSNGVGKEKKFYAKKWYKMSLCRLRPRLLHAMLDYVLIVYLVIFAVAWLVSND
jgi:hypothetical protein